MVIKPIIAKADGFIRFFWACMQEKIKVYQYKKHKLLVALMEPLLVGTLIAILLFGLPPNEKAAIPLSGRLFFVIILANMYVVPKAYLIYRHWKYGRRAELVVDGTHFILETGDNVLRFDQAAVDSIIRFASNGRTPWGWGCWWELVIEGKVFYLSCLVVPGSVMERYFSKKVVEKTVFWPDIRKDKLMSGFPYG